MPGFSDGATKAPLSLVKSFCATLVALLVTVTDALGTADHVRLEAVLKRLFEHADTDVREAAYQLATRLPEPRARSLLQEATTTERDPELRDELTRFVDDIGG